MDPRNNPYTPNAGATPPVLVGRAQELMAFDILLDRLSAGRTEQSMIITGLRGVGKTVLLAEFRKTALSKDWAVIEIEIAKHDDDQFRHALAREVRKALFAIAPRKKWGDRARRAASVLRSFSLSVDPDGRVSAGLNVEPLIGEADSGALDADLADLFVALGEAAVEHNTGVVLLIDEIQFLNQTQFEATIAAIHKTVQRALPITMTAAGLPQMAELAGEAKSYAERLFSFPKIGKLDAEDAQTVLAEPASLEGVTWTEAALETALDFTEGYPYFLQEFGQAAWEAASDSPIKIEDATVARDVVEEKLDAGFFKVRHNRTTELESAYLRAMAELGPNPQRAATVAKLLDRTSQQCGPTRATLIQKGLLYTPEHGYAAFTVPQFDKYMKRVIPTLVVPPKKKRLRR